MSHSELHTEVGSRAVTLCAFAFLLAVVTGCLFGCVIADPGGQARRTVSTSAEYTWSETGQFTAKIVGPQTGKFVMGEGEIVTKTLEDGSVVLDTDASRFTAFLMYDPSGKDAVAAGAIYAQAGADMVKYATSVVNTALNKIPSPVKPIP